MLKRINPLTGGTLPPAADPELDKALGALAKCDWGQDPKALQAIDVAMGAARQNPALRKDLEARLASILKTDAPRAAKIVACRKLSRIGSATSVPSLATLLPDAELSHMARYALERMECAEAGKALLAALPRLKGKQKTGVINSLGARRDTAAAIPLIAMLGEDDLVVVGACIAALGRIGTLVSSKALQGMIAEGPKKLRRITANAALTCSEQLLMDKKKQVAVSLYKMLDTSTQPEHVRQAAKRGLDAASKN